jgi:hypothetical protein
MKSLTLQLTITFSENIYTDEEVGEVAENVRDALVHAVNTAGLTPYGSEAHTEEISIIELSSDLEINYFF